MNNYPLYLLLVLPWALILVEILYLGYLIWGEAIAVEVKDPEVNLTAELTHVPKVEQSIELAN